MPFRAPIRQRKRRRRIGSDFDLQLTSLLDVMVIILVFLLKSATVSTNTFITAPGIELPVSATQSFPPESVMVMISPESMIFENQKIVEFVQTPDSVAVKENPQFSFQKTDLDEGGRRIVPLYDALVKAREKDEFLRAKSKARDESGNPLPFDGILAIQADKHINYDVLRKVMYTAASAGFRVYNFLAMSKEFR